MTSPILRTTWSLARPHCLVKSFHMCACSNLLVIQTHSMRVQLFFCFMPSATLGIALVARVCRHAFVGPCSWSFGPDPYALLLRSYLPCFFNTNCVLIFESANIFVFTGMGLSNLSPSDACMCTCAALCCCYCVAHCQAWITIKASLQHDSLRASRQTKGPVCHDFP